MTLAAAWISKQLDSECLVVASDSRLTGGETWDCCPKIFPLPRNDSALCFSGATQRAYPLMIQIYNSVAMHDKVCSRAYDLVDLKGHILNIITSMILQVTDKPTPDTSRNDDFSLILCGYSWKLSCFKIWTLRYNTKLKSFYFKESKSRNRNLSVKMYSFSGCDVKTAEIIMEGYNSATNKKPTSHMAPAMVIRDMINSAAHPSIGGPLQLIKIYKHMNILPHNVYWNNNNAQVITLFGRLLLPYEKNKYLTLCPLSMDIVEPTVAFVQCK